MLVTSDNCEGVIRSLETKKQLVVDTETTGLKMYTGDCVVGVAIKPKGEQDSFYFPLRHSHQNLDAFQKMLLTAVYRGPMDTPNLPEQARLDLVKLLSDQSREYTGFNYGFDSKMLAQEGVPLQQNVKDAQIAAHLVNENEPSLSLKKLSDRYLGGGSSKEQKSLDEVLLYMAFKKNEMGRLPPEIVGRYACMDVQLTDDLLEFYQKPMSDWDLHDIFNRTCTYLWAVTKMEHRGLKLDIDMINRYIEESIVMEQQTLKEVQQMAGFPINLASPKQVCKWLNIESSRIEILEDMMHDNPAIKKIVDFRSWQKVRNTYYTKFLENRSAHDRIHPNINITGTYTGRASSNDPNMQALPVYDNIYKVKDVFVADEDHYLVEADYSQAEIRWATYYAQEETMAEKLFRGADIHTETAHEINIPRDSAKRLNFSVIYGIGAKTFAEKNKIPETKAKEYLDKYHARYPGFRRMYRNLERVASDRKWIRLHNGRYRHYNTAEAESHKASSNLIQGSVGAMVQDAITELNERGFKMHLQVHDSIVLSIPKATFEKDIKEVKEVMEKDRWSHRNKTKFTIPTVVDIKYGERWGAMTKYKVPA